MSALLAAGADTDAAMRAGATPLHDAAMDGHAAVVYALLDSPLATVNQSADLAPKPYRLR